MSYIKRTTNCICVAKPKYSDVNNVVRQSKRIRRKKEYSRYAFVVAVMDEIIASKIKRDVIKIMNFELMARVPRRKHLRVYLYFVCVYYIKTITTKCLCRHSNREKPFLLAHTSDDDDDDEKLTGNDRRRPEIDGNIGIENRPADAYLRVKPPGALGIAQMTRRGNDEDRQRSSAYRGRGAPIGSLG